MSMPQTGPSSHCQTEPDHLSLSDAEMQDQQAANGSEHRLQDVAAARSAMADELAAGPSGFNEDEAADEDDLFTVHASALGAGAAASAEPAGEASMAAPAGDPPPASGAFSFSIVE